MISFLIVDSNVFIFILYISYIIHSYQYVWIIYFHYNSFVKIDHIERPFYSPGFILDLERNKNGIIEDYEISYFIPHRL